MFLRNRLGTRGGYYPVSYFRLLGSAIKVLGIWQELRIICRKITLEKSLRAYLPEATAKVGD